MANFQTYLPLLQQVEGRFQKNPKDGGNYNSSGELVGTNYGISARFYEGVIKRSPSEADMRAITKSKAAILYRAYFWDKQRANEINSQAMANTIIDHQVNAGDGVLVAQELLNKSFGFEVGTDNQIGKETLGALNRVDPARFVTLFNQERAEHYRTRSNSAEFAEGWLRRLKKFSVEFEKKNGFLNLLLVGGIAFAGYHLYKSETEIQEFKKKL